MPNDQPGHLAQQPAFHSLAASIIEDKENEADESSFESEKQNRKGTYKMRQSKLNLPTERPQSPDNLNQAGHEKWEHSLSTLKNDSSVSQPAQDTSKQNFFPAQ